MSISKGSVGRWGWGSTAGWGLADRRIQAINRWLVTSPRAPAHAIRQNLTARARSPARKAPTPAGQSNAFNVSTEFDFTSNDLVNNRTDYDDCCGRDERGKLAKLAFLYKRFRYRDQRF
ncbi:MAG: hypothetical protein MUO51_06965 [Woeseiaceae bacterium]|nr:hypothetical protein [Woeseiaceae bacterium]